MHYGIESIRCDVPMRKSKERCRRPSGKRWRCDKECRKCICCLIKSADGTERHYNPTEGEKNEIQHPQQIL